MTCSNYTEFQQNCQPQSRFGPPGAQRKRVAVEVASLLGGNGCNHHPANPQWFSPPEAHKARPRILCKLGEKIRAYYYNPNTVLPSLNFANGRSRQQRSERREACLQVLGCLTHYLDLATLRVGIPSGDGAFRGIRMARIAELCGIGLRRAERAIRDLVAAGIIQVHPIAKIKASGEYTGYAAIRTVPESLFKAFGLGLWLRHERTKASKRAQKQQRTEEPLGRLELQIEAAKAKEARPDRAQAPKQAKPPKTKTGRSALDHLRAIIAGGQQPP